MAAATQVEDTPMFCFQCEQTFKSQACTTMGICKKDADLASLMDNLMYGVQSISVFANRALSKGKTIPTEVDEFVTDASFATLTNENFSQEDIRELIFRAKKHRDQMKELAGPQEKLPEVCKWEPNKTIPELITQAHQYRIDHRFNTIGKDRTCLQELFVYGIKGLAAYMHHSARFNGRSTEVMAYVYKAYSSIHEDPNPELGKLLDLCLECGQANFKAMKLLDECHTTAYGNPTPVTIPWVRTPQEAPKQGKCILISGHDLLVMDALMKQIEAKGYKDVHVYTHGEMLPAHGYPKLRAHKCLAGHYGTAWQNQLKEFAEFPGPVLMTTNCYVPAPPTYVDKVFAINPVGGPNVKKICHTDMSAIIEMARSMPGLPAPTSPPPKTLTVGFGRQTVIDSAGKVLGAIGEGKLKKIFVIGGCDGYERERNYFTEVAEKLPKETLILTCACGKFKINGIDHGNLADTGLPRLLDMGQCNDSYGVIQTALALSKATGKDVNDLPLAIVLSWFEQKAVAILLTLLSLGIKNIYIGPRPPGFFTPAILGILADKFQLHLAGDSTRDVETLMGTK